MTNRVDGIDLSLTLDKAKSADRVAAAQHRLTQLRLFTAGLLQPDVVAPGLVVLFEGFDAAGKGGAIRRLTASIDPRHVRVRRPTSCATCSCGDSSPRFRAPAG